MLIGYRRVSSTDQNMDRQELGKLDKLFEEKVSGAKRDRPALKEMMEFAREGDEVLVYSIDRLARDLRDLQSIVDALNSKGVSILFISEALAFKAGAESDPFAKLQLQMMGAFAEFERNIIRRRQREGIRKAKEKGVYSGRKPTINVGKVKELKDKGIGASEIARQMEISRASVYRVLE